MICLEKTIDEYVESGILEHIAVRVGQGNHVIYDTYRGGVDETTLFDMASVTKIMVTTSLALIVNAAEATSLLVHPLLTAIALTVAP